MADAAGIVLAGGRSTRMGSPKAALEWHGSTLLRRITGIVGRAVDGPVVVVRAPGQALPALPDGVEVVEDLGEVQNAYSILDRTNEPLLDFCREREIAFVPFFPLGSAFMGGPRPCSPRGGRPRSSRG